MNRFLIVIEVKIFGTVVGDMNQIGAIIKGVKMNLFLLLELSHPFGPTIRQRTMHIAQLLLVAGVLFGQFC